MTNKPNYEAETLGEENDDGTMPTNVATLADAVVGHKIVSVEKNAQIPEGTSHWRRSTGTALTLDNGKRVFLANTDDCCAYTELEAFLLHPERIDRLIDELNAARTA